MAKREDIQNLIKSLFFLILLSSCMGQQGPAAATAPTSSASPEPAPDAPTVPDPTNLDIEVDSSSAVTLTWDSGGGSTIDYRIAYALGAVAPADCNSGTQVSEDNISEHNEDSDTTSHQITGLDPDSQYSFRVCAVDADSNQSEGVTDSATTIQAIPPNPINLTSVADGLNHITLTWDNGGNPTSDYRLSYALGAVAPADCSSGTQVSEASISEHNVDGDTTSYQISGLSEYTEYSFRVCSINSNPTPDQSSGVTITQKTLKFENKILALDGEANDRFGAKVDMDGIWAISGQHLDDDNGVDAGAAYIYKFNGVDWIQHQKIVGSDTVAGDSFGANVAISGTALAVSATGDSDNDLDSGSVYIFRYNGNTWVEEDKIIASDGAKFDAFGSGLGISGDKIVVGAFRDQDNGSFSGSAYTFSHNAGNWTQTQKIVPATGAANYRFGSVAKISGDVLVIGAPAEDTGGAGGGALHIYRHNGASWVADEILLPPDPFSAGDAFGTSVDMSSEDLIIVGATTVNTAATAAGAAYIYRYTLGSWTKEANLYASDAQNSDFFGASVAIDDNIAIIGAPQEDINGAESGSIYKFEFNGAIWTESQKIDPTDGAAGDKFGSHINIDGTNLITGSDLDDDDGAESGSAYIFYVGDL